MRHITNKIVISLILTYFFCSISGCSTPKHSNTLIFGTSTKFALDASQDTSGAVGITLGYKRQEAVWMPLLANVANGTETVPATCLNDPCREFKGTTGTSGGAASVGATDTYSVLATFSGQAGASAGAGGNETPGVKANGTLAQYFATGIAARLLAEHGGASIVNTGGTKTESTTKLETIQAVKKTITEENANIDRIMFSITGKDGTLDQAKYNTLLAKSKLDGNTQALLKKYTTAKDIHEHLSFAYATSGKPLFDALD